MNKKLTLDNLAEIIQWCGLKTVEEIIQAIIPIIDNNEKWSKYKSLFENVVENLKDNELKNTIIPNEIISAILDTLGMVVFYRKL